MTGRRSAAAFLAFGVCIPAAGQDLIYRLEGLQPGAAFGQRVAAAGDVDGDGTPDIVVGVPRLRAFPITFGAVGVYSGRNGSRIRTLYPAAYAEGYGQAVAGVGDVDGDGHDDVLIGVAGSPNLGPRFAEVRSGRNSSVLMTLRGSGHLDSEFGWSVDRAGDVNGDGTPDLIVGDPYEPAGQLRAQGRARVFSGVDGTLLHTFDAVAAHDEFGWAVAGAGDVDRDGRDDVIVGAHDGNYAHVYSGRDGRLLLAIPGRDPFAQTGASVDGVGDMDHDGYDDVIVGGDYFQFPGPGYAEVRSGRDGGVIHLVIGRDGESFGSPVAGCGDANGDGYPDFLVGALRYRTSGSAYLTGAVYLHSGQDGRELRRFAGGAAFDYFGVSVAGIGDINHDGCPDVAIGAPQDPNTGVGYVGVHSSQPLVLSADVHRLPARAGGTQTLCIEAGASHVGAWYGLFGSATGTVPGTSLGSITVPLVPDAYTVLVIGAAGSTTLQGFFGTLDASGTARASLRIPADTVPPGLNLFHACVVFDATSLRLASNAASLLVE